MIMTNEEVVQRLAEINARVEAATPGEWTASLCEWVCINSLEHSDQCKEDCSSCDDAAIAQGAFVPQVNTVEYNGYVGMNDADAEFCAHAKTDIPWLLGRIKAQEAGLDELQERNAKLEESGVRFLMDGAHKVFEEERRTYISRKWARRWKRIAKYVGGRSCLDSITYGQECLEHKAMVCNEQAQRIAALENAARSCVTCVYYTSDLEPIPEYCNKHCRKPDVRHAGWQFDEKRWAPKGEKDDNHRD